MALDDPLSGAQFSRNVGTDPEKWAARFLAVYAEAEGVRTDADRLAFVTAWFRDAMEAAVKAASVSVSFWDAPAWPELDNDPRHKKLSE